MKIVKIIVVFLIIALIITPFLYVKINKNIYANRVTEYLLNKEHYKMNEIKSVRGVWGKKLPAFYAVVTFEDNPTLNIFISHTIMLNSLDI
jgi:hypothetical protein